MKTIALGAVVAWKKSTEVALASEVMQEKRKQEKINVEMPLFVHMAWPVAGSKIKVLRMAWPVAGSN